MLVRIFDPDRDDVARLEPAGVAQMDLAVDFGRVGLGAAGGADPVSVRSMRERASTRSISSMVEPTLAASFSALIRAESGHDRS